MLLVEAFLQRFKRFNIPMSCLDEGLGKKCLLEREPIKILHEGEIKYLNPINL